MFNPGNPFVWTLPARFCAAQNPAGSRSFFFSPALYFFFEPHRLGSWFLFEASSVLLVSFSSPSTYLGLRLGIRLGTLFGSVQPVLVLVGLLAFSFSFPLPFPSSSHWLHYNNSVSTSDGFSIRTCPAAIHSASENVHPAAKHWI